MASEIDGYFSSVRFSDKIKAAPMVSVDQALQGNVAGLQMSTTSGTPGSSQDIRIRGRNSINAGNDPLFVIDGVPISNDNNRGLGANNPGSSYAEQPINILSTINPTDIESIQVLKDASAAAIYGSRGSNGVVIITTTDGKPKNRP